MPKTTLSDTPGGLRVYDTGGDGFPLIYHHGSPNVGEPPAPLVEPARALGLRWIGFDRPGYGGTARRPGRDIASAAAYATEVADSLGLGQFAVLGHSGGGAHALACAALAPERCVAAVSISGLAPYNAAGLDWFAGINAGGQAELRAATQGPEALAAHLEVAEFDPSMFTEDDFAQLQGDWSWFMEVVNKAQADGPGPFIDDDVASVSSWGFDPADISRPTLIVHGTDDRVVPCAHGEWLATHIDGAELLAVEGAGHIGVMRRAADALTWIAHRVGQA